MLKLDELAFQVKSFRTGQADLDQFEDWFRTNSRGAYRRRGEGLSDVVAAIEAALSRYHFEGLDESEMREELASAIRPFESSSHARTYDLVCVGEPPVKTRSISRSIPLVGQKKPSLLLVSGQSRPQFVPPPDHQYELLHNTYQFVLPRGLDSRLSRPLLGGFSFPPTFQILT